VARHGAEAVGEGNTASAEWRKAADRARRDTEQAHVDAHPRPAWEPEVLVRADHARLGENDGRDKRDGRVPRKTRPLPTEVVGELVSAAGPRRAGKLERDLASAAQAYSAGRYYDAEKLLRPLAEAVPGSAGVRELYGLTLYRTGRWKLAKAELDAYHALTGDVTQYPVVADCERALGRHAVVDELWAELRQASPGVEILSEGRLVVAGSLADRGQMQDAIALLAPYAPNRARPKEWHLRTWYALADLYERAGELPRARELFRRLAAIDDDFFDVTERLAGLR
jgi:thioredoxin-like negative regulator of GroEL